MAVFAGIVGFCLTFIGLGVVYLSYQLSELSHDCGKLLEEVKTLRRVLVHEMADEEEHDYA